MTYEIKIETLSHSTCESGVEEKIMDAYRNSAYEQTATKACMRVLASREIKKTTLDVGVHRISCFIPLKCETDLCMYIVW